MLYSNMTFYAEFYIGIGTNAKLLSSLYSEANIILKPRYMLLIPLRIDITNHSAAARWGRAGCSGEGRMWGSGETRAMCPVHQKVMVSLSQLASQVTPPSLRCENSIRSESSLDKSFSTMFFKIYLNK